MSDPGTPLSTPRPWDLVSDAYAAEVVPQLERYADVALDLCDVGVATRVLDVACGPGTLALRAARRGATVTAVDFSPAMIERLCVRHGSEPELRVTSRVGDGMALDDDDDAFDAAFSMFGLIFFPDRARGLRELLRVTRPGGRVLVSSWVPFDRVPVFSSVSRAILDALAIPPRPPILVMSSSDDARSELIAVGLREVEVHTATFVTEYGSTEEAFAAFARTAAPIALLRAQSADRWPVAAQAALRSVVAQLGAGPQRVEMSALLTTGRVPRRG